MDWEFLLATFERAKTRILEKGYAGATTSGMVYLIESILLPKAIRKKQQNIALSIQKAHGVRLVSS